MNEKLSQKIQSQCGEHISILNRWIFPNFGYVGEGKFVPDLNGTIEEICSGSKVMNDCIQVYLRGSDMAVCDEFSS